MKYESSPPDLTMPGLVNLIRSAGSAASPTGTETWYRKHVDMPQSHVVKRGSQFYFRIAVPLPLTKLVGKREIKASLRTSDAMSAKMRGRVLSNGLELLFRELRSMADVSNDVIVNRAKDYFEAQLSKSLELAFDLPRDPLIDIDFEITGTEQLATKMREALKQQHFSPSVQSDARACEARCQHSRQNNSFAERLIGSIRRECLDHIIVLGRGTSASDSEKLCGLLCVRTHRSLNKDAPVSRQVQRSGVINSRAILGGLHRQYVRI